MYIHHFCREKVTINSTKPYITLLGAGMNRTIITWGDVAGDFDDSDVLLKTFRSATVGINSEWFIAKGIQFRVSKWTQITLPFLYCLSQSCSCITLTDSYIFTSRLILTMHFQNLQALCVYPLQLSYSASQIPAQDWICVSVLKLLQLSLPYLGSSSSSLEAWDVNFLF